LFPEFHFAEAAGGEASAVWAEGEGLCDIAMGDAGLLVESGLDEGFVGELSDEALGGEVVEADLIGAGGSGEVTPRCDGDGVDGLQASWQ
jgi:hypothetical protein